MIAPNVKRILIVDDDVAMLELLSEALKDDFAISVADNGSEALRLIEENDPFSVIMSDMYMADMDGIELLEKAQSLSKDSVRVMLTGDNDQGTAIQAINEAGIFKFLHKPLNLVELRHEMEEAYQQFEQNIKIERLTRMGSESKEKFMNTVSHELKTPLNPIIGFSQLLADEITSTEGQEYVEGIAEAGQELLKKIDTILKYVDTSDERSHFDVIAFRPRVLLEELFAQFQMAAFEKGIELEFSISDQVPRAVRADREKLQAVLEQLLDNAIKFSDEGVVRIQIEAWRVFSEKAHLSIRVMDSGPGIKPEMRAAIYEPFLQVDQSDTRGSEGLGLGLAMCRKLVKRMGGELQLLDNVAQGACFEIKVPIAQEFRMGSGLSRRCVPA